MEWKLTDDRPIWMQLSEQMARRIVAGQYPPGSKLPAVRELAADAGVNPNTMQRALAQLENDGLAVSNRTAGRMVTENIAAIEAVRRNMARQLAELRKILNKEAFDHSGLIYGMGHAVYTLSDPREVILKKFARQLAEEFLSAIQDLGYTRDDVMALWKEEEHHG